MLNERRENGPTGGRADGMAEQQARPCRIQTRRRALRSRLGWDELLLDREVGQLLAGIDGVTQPLRALATATPGATAVVLELDFGR